MTRLTASLLLALAVTLPTAQPVSATSLLFNAYRGDTQSSAYITISNAANGDIYNNRFSRYGNPTLDNDIEGVLVNMATNRCLVLYSGANFDGVTYAIHGDGGYHWYNLPDSHDNIHSSFRHGTVAGGVCRSPWYT